MVRDSRRAASRTFPWPWRWASHWAISAWISSTARRSFSSEVTKCFGGVYRRLLALGQYLAGQGVDFGDALNLVAPELDAKGNLLVGGEHLQGVALDAEPAADKAGVVALVLHGHQVPHQAAAGAAFSHLEGGDEGVVLLRVSQAVDAGDGGDDEDVAAGQQGPGGGVAELVDLLVDVGVLLDVGVGLGDVGLRLIVVVVGDEVLHGVVGGRTP